MRTPLDRQRVLALLWLVGGCLTGLSLVLPYSVDVPLAPRAAVGIISLAGALALWRAPSLPTAALHALVAAGTGLIAYCSHLGAPGVEGVMFLLPVAYAFATFPPREAAGHLVLAVSLFGLILLTAEEGRTIAPWISFVFVSGVGATLSFAIAAILDLRARERVAAERDRRIADELQGSLLPATLPAVDGALLAARYLPAAREADVGGDLYDAFVLPSGRLALAVGDVAGKGLQAAQAVGALRAALRAYAIEDAAPATVLTRLDRFAGIAGTSRSGDPMATMLLAVLDPATGTVEWASAGHPPPLLLGSAPAFLEGAPGAPLGYEGEDARAVPHVMHLAEGEALLLFSDGLIERRGEALDAGMRRLARAAVAAGGVALPVLLDAVLPIAPRPLQDDVTALVVRRTPGRGAEEAQRATVPAEGPALRTAPAS